mgnify:CR=1 FL=1
MEETKDIQAQENKETSEISSQETEIQKLKENVEEQKDKYLRLFADFENYKRRMAKERIELIQTAGKDVIQSLLEVLDDCDRAEKRIPEDPEKKAEWEGVLLVFNKLRHSLQQKGLKSMESLHTDFDVEKHEAITEIDAPEELKGKVVDELEKGYLLQDKIIR